MCRNYKFVQEQMQGRSEHQIHEELTRMSRESVTYSEEITLGLIVSMLVDNSNDNSHRVCIIDYCLYIKIQYYNIIRYSLAIPYYHIVKS